MSYVKHAVECPKCGVWLFTAHHNPSHPNAYKKVINKHTCKNGHELYIEECITGYHIMTIEEN